MWAITNDTPFAADRSLTRGVDGQEIWIVAVRGTYRLHQDGPVLDPEQQSVCEAPKCTGEAGASSLRYESDFVRTKTGTDVLVHGAACAPQGASETVDVSLRVGPVDKTLRIYGERHWTSGFIGMRALFESSVFAVRQGAQLGARLARREVVRPLLDRLIQRRSRYSLAAALDLATFHDSGHTTDLGCVDALQEARAFAHGFLSCKGIGLHSEGLFDALSRGKDHQGSMGRQRLDGVE